MCLAIPGLVKDVAQEGGLRVGRVEFGGVARRVCLEMVPDAGPGAYVLVHAGFAIARIDEAEARRTFALLQEAAAAEPR